MYASRNKKSQRKTQPSLEHLDMRIAPTAMGAAVALAAELKVEARQVHRWEAALATAQSGSRHQEMLSNRIAHTEARISSQEVRLARIEASTLSSANASSMYRIKGQSPPTSPPPSPTNPEPFAVTGANASPMYRIKGQSPPTSPPPSPTNPEPFAVVPGPVGGSVPTTSGTSASISTGSSGGQSTTTTTTTGSGSTGSTLPSNVSVILADIYNAYEQDPSSFPANLPSTDAGDKVIIQGSNVGIQVQDSNPADFAAMVSSLQSDGMQIQASSAINGTVVGMLPIAELPAVAQLTNAPSVTPLMQPTF